MYKRTACKMNRGEIIHQLNEIEIHDNPYGVTVDGAPIWPVVRLAIGNQQLATLTANAPPSSSSTIVQKTRNLVHGLFQDLFFPGHALQKPLLFFSSPVYRAVDVPYSIDKFAHPFIEAAVALGRPSVLMAKGQRPVPPLPSIPGSRTIWTDDLLEYHRKVHPVKGLHELDSACKHLLTLVLDRFDNVEKVSVVRRLHVFRSYLAAYRRIIARTAPVHVFVTCWYTEENMAIAQACAELGIPCTDLQHGVQGPVHLAYGQWASLPETGCSTIPSSFWCWDEASARNIGTWAPQHVHRPWVGGSIWLERRSAQTRNAPRNVLFTLQPINHALPTELAHVIRNRPRGELWVFRPHPRALDQAQEILSWARGSDLEDKIAIEDPRAKMITESLNESAIHVTFFSSSILEAGYLGVPSIALDPSAADIFSSQISDGSLMICTRMDELNACLEGARRKPSAMRPPLNERLASFLHWEREAVGRSVQTPNDH